jgi:hypothetical protein
MGITKRGKHNKNKNRKTQKKIGKSFKKLKCSPKNPKDIKEFTCYTSDSLNKLKKYWNARHPDEKILTNNSQEIWARLKENMADVCDTEACWLRQKFVENDLDAELRNYTFAPKSPATWNRNKNEWLTSVDIEKVMKQYEKTYQNFTFIGPSPLDFDNKKIYNTCVWEELCNFDLKKYLTKNKTKIGIIFNMDPHYKDGSHWMCMMVDITKQLIYYFDSNGDKCPNEIKVLVERIKQQGHAFNLDFKFEENHPIEHQEGDTECGMYVLYFIVEILTGKRDYKFFTTKKITDEDVEKYRKIFFNPTL